MTVDPSSKEWAPFNRDVSNNEGYLYTTGSSLSSHDRQSPPQRCHLGRGRLSWQACDRRRVRRRHLHHRALRPRWPASIYAFDPAPNAIEVGRKKAGGRNITFEVHSAYDIPCADNSFDIAHLRGVLHHMDRPVDALREALRVASTIVVLEPNGYNMVLKADREALKVPPRTQREVLPALPTRALDHGTGGSGQDPRLALPRPVFLPRLARPHDQVLGAARGVHAAGRPLRVRLVPHGRDARGLITSECTSVTHRSFANPGQGRRRQRPGPGRRRVEGRPPCRHGGRWPGHGRRSRLRSRRSSYPECNRARCMARWRASTTDARRLGPRSTASRTPKRSATARAIASMVTIGSASKVSSARMAATVCGSSRSDPGRRDAGVGRRRRALSRSPALLIAIEPGFQGRAGRSSRRGCGSRRRPGRSSRPPRPGAPARGRRRAGGRSAGVRPVRADRSGPSGPPAGG